MCIDYIVTINVFIIILSATYSESMSISMEEREKLAMIEPQTVSDLWRVYLIKQNCNKYFKSPISDCGRD